MARYMTLGPVPMPDGTSATRPSFYSTDWLPVDANGVPVLPSGAIPVTQAQVDHYMARQPWCHWDTGAADFVDDPVPLAPAPAATVTGNQWAFALSSLGLSAAWQVGVTKSKASDQVRAGLIARDTPLVAADPLLARVAANAGTTDGTKDGPLIIVVSTVFTTAQGMPL